jgi:hypothetical protein
MALLRRLLIEPFMTKRPIAITLIAWLFILVGAGTLIGALFVALLADSSHIHDPLGRFHGHELLAIGVAVGAGVGGLLLLKRKGWGRWLILAWLVFHTVMSYRHGMTKFVVYLGLTVVIGTLLFLPTASAYLRGERDQTT